MTVTHVDLLRIADAPAESESCGIEDEAGEIAVVVETREFF